MAINSLTPSSKGLSGLASGMDTQSMVEQMLKGTQAKMDSQNQKKSVLSYKQEMYRSVAAQIKAFQNQFFSFTKADTNLLSSSLYQTMNAATQSKFLTAKAASGATLGKITIDSITALARNHREVSATKATGDLKGVFNSDALKKITDKLTDATNANISIKIGEGDSAKEVTVAFKDIAGKSMPDAVDIINDALRAAGEFTTKAEFAENKFVIQNNDGKAVSVTGGSNIPGVVNSASSSGNQSVFNLDTKSILPKITLNVDGVSKSISFNPLTATGTESEKKADILRQLNANVQTAFGAGISFSEDARGDIKMSVDNTSSKVVVSGDESTLSVIGFKNNLSNKVSTNKSIRDVNFATPLAGNMQKFSINGTDFSFSGGESISNIMATINSSDAGVRVSYDSVRDRFMIESNTSGELINTANGTPFKFEQSEGNLLTVMFGANPSDTYSSNVLQVTNMRSSATFDPSTFKYDGGTVSFKVIIDGKETNYNLGPVPKNEGTPPDPQTTIDEINKLIMKNDALVDKTDPDNPKAKVEFKLSGNTVSLVSNDSNLTAKVTGEGMAAFGFTEKVSGSTFMSEMGLDDFTMKINGVDVAVSKNSTLDQFMQQLRDNGAGAASLETIGSTPFIRLAGVSIPMQFPEPAASKLFGNEIQGGDGKMPTGKFSTNAADGYVMGSNAEAVVNGETITRNSNNFTIDGVSITLTGTTNEKQEIDISQNTDVVFDAVKKFVEEYNKVVNDINKLIDADPSYKKYPPLTAAEKKEMSESEIKLWEEKARGGLLRGDNTLVSIQASLRSTLYTKPDAGGLALYDLGIRTDFFGTKDNIVIEDEAELKAKIAENPDAVRRLFTDAEKGLATLMNNAMDKAASSGSRPGSLVQMAGATTADVNSTIYRQMKQIDDTLDRLELKYESEYNRYWKQFNAMEQQIAQMNQQSGWLAQQFA